MVSRGSSSNVAGVTQALQTNSKASYPPHPSLAGCEAGSFAEATITKRLPAIIASMLKDMEAAAVSSGDAQAEFKVAISKISTLREEMLANAALRPLTGSTLSAGCAVAPLIEHSNEVLADWKKHSGKDAWLDLPWLLIECYMYLRIAEAIQSQPKLAAMKFDPFGSQKKSAFVKSHASVCSMAEEVKGLIDSSEGWKSSGKSSEALKEKFFQVMQYSLWGNKTDLSLLVDASKIDPAALAVSGAGGAGPSGQPFLIVDEFEQIWDLLEQKRQKGGPMGRMDIILDNTGLELYGDLCLADFLLEYGLADVVVLHGKTLPWFVSDTMSQDLDATLEMCCRRPTEVPESAAWDSVQSLGMRWRDHINAGRIKYNDHDFWCTPDPFCWMKTVSPDLYSNLAESTLLIFKGDLNYRKLSYDCRWPLTTPFRESLMGFEPAPFVSLRTLKADVITGLKEGQGEALDRVDADWQVNGKFGIIQANV